MKEVETSNCEEKADLFIKELTVFILHGCFHRIMDFLGALWKYHRSENTLGVIIPNEIYGLINLLCACL